MGRLASKPASWLPLSCMRLLTCVAAVTVHHRDRLDGGYHDVPTAATFGNCPPAIIRTVIRVESLRRCAVTCLRFGQSTGVVIRSRRVSPHRPRVGGLLPARYQAPSYLPSVEEPSFHSIVRSRDRNGTRPLFRTRQRGLYCQA